MRPTDERALLRHSTAESVARRNYPWRRDRAGRRVSHPDSSHRSQCGRGALPIGDRSAEVAAGGAGWLPVLCFLAASGLLLVSVAYMAARQEAAWAPALFWAALLLIYLPVVARLLSNGASRGERLGLVLMLGIAMYLVKVLRNPTGFGFHDELLHWSTADDIITSGHLFGESPMLVVSPLYPGLEVVTAALAQLSGLDIFGAGIVVVGAARVVLVLALYLLFEGVTQSARVAGLATALYMTNPKFIFFNSLFAYESLALPLLVLVLFVMERRSRVSGRTRLSLTMVALLTTFALVTTHHLTSLALVGMLFGWSLVHRLVRTQGDQEPDPWGMATLAAGATVVWFVFVATATIGYLGGPAINTVVGLAEIIAGEEGPKELFTTATGQVAPAWERLVGIASVAVVLVALPIGLLTLWRNHRRSAAVLLGAVALSYPLTLPLRLVGRADISGRAWSFIFLGVALVVALAIWRIALRVRWRAAWRTAVLAPIAVMLVGGLIIGLPAWARMPGPYLAGADVRSINAESIAAAQWARSVLGTDNRLAADATNRLLMGSYGGQHVVWGQQGESELSRVFLSPTFGRTEERLLQDHQVEYVLIDRRLAGVVPISGEYFEKGENLRIRDGRPLDAATLAKFDSLSMVSRVFDSGHVQVYDVGGVAGER